MAHTHKKVFLVYGYDHSHFSQLIKEQDAFVYLVEPRKAFIDLFKKDFTSSSNKYQFLPKCLHHDPKVLQTFLSSNKETEQHTYSPNPETHIGTNHDYIRESVFCTTISSIIERYKLQSVHSIVFNIVQKEMDKIIAEAEQYHNMIEHIFVNIKYDSSKLILPTIFRNTTLDTQLPDFMTFENKNLTMTMPSICAFVVDYPMTNSTEFLKLVKQYNMDVFLNNDGSSPRIISASDLQLSDLQTNMRKKFVTSDIPDSLVHIFKSKYYDVILQFNTKHFTHNKTFQLLYPIRDHTIFLKRDMDILYSNGRTMYKLYNTMYSEEFKIYMRAKEQEKPKLYKFFEKKYFYDYIQNNFSIQVI